MSKQITSFVCQQCGYNSPQWMGKCPECSSWNSFVETIEQKTTGRKATRSRTTIVQPQRLKDVTSEAKRHTPTGFVEFDRVLGGGIVKGAVMLLSGDPGIGKSTLLLQVALNFSSSVLYVSGEESAQQIKLRADRLKQYNNANETPYILTEVEVDTIIDTIRKLKPGLVVVDSIQTMESESLTGIAGSVGQVRECAARLVRVAKEEGIPIFLVGHVTKEGTIAGPMVLSHMVDAVLFLEGERFKTLRILRSLKNRFGPVDEVGVFKIEQNGINEVKNPSELFLSVDSAEAKKKDVPGSIVVAAIEGTRPMLVEVQALVLPTKLAFPRRVVSGLDAKRVELLCAVLQRQAGLPLDRYDIFLNVAGGLKLSEPGIDLGICLAIASSLNNVPLKSAVAIAEVGLLGELRDVSDRGKREHEAKRLGFTQVFSVQLYKTIGDVMKKVGRYGQKKRT